MAEENDYTTIRLTNETKELLEETRSKVPFENAKSMDDFIKHLIENYKENN